MIDGLKVDMTTAELRARIADRVAWHEHVAERAEALCRNDDGDEPNRGRVAAHEARLHREQAQTLALLRDHLVPNEVYRLGEFDLRFADLVDDGLVDLPELSDVTVS